MNACTSPDVVLKSLKYQRSGFSGHFCDHWHAGLVALHLSLSTEPQGVVPITPKALCGKALQII